MSANGRWDPNERPAGAPQAGARGQTPTPDPNLKNFQIEQDRLTATAKAIAGFTNLNMMPGRIMESADPIDDVTSETVYATVHPYTETIDGRTWTSTDEMATEVEVQEFLRALVRLVKPETCIETGCYKGGATVALACALSMNNRGVLHTCDVDPAVRREMIERLREFDSNANCVVSCVMTGVEMIHSMVDPIDFAFLDSGGDRLEEAQALLQKMADGGYIVIHDANRPKEGEAAEWLVMHSGKCLVMDFPTPRGLAVLRVWR